MTMLRLVVGTAIGYIVGEVILRNLEKFISKEADRLGLNDEGEDDPQRIESLELDDTSATITRANGDVENLSFDKGTSLLEVLSKHPDIENDPHLRKVLETFDTLKYAEGDMQHTSGHAVKVTSSEDGVPPELSEEHAHPETKEALAQAVDQQGDNPQMGTADAAAAGLDVIPSNNSEGEESSETTTPEGESNTEETR